MLGLRTPLYLVHPVVTVLMPSSQAVLKPTPQAEERLAEATLAVTSPPASADHHHSAPAMNGAPLADGDVHVPVDDAAAEVAGPQEPALKVRQDA